MSGGGIGGSLFAVVAALLDFIQEFEVFLEGALEAALVEGEQVQILAAIEPGLGLGEGNGGFFVVAFHLVGLAEGDGDDGVFDLGRAFDAPPAIGDGLGEVGFNRAFGGEVLHVSGAVLFVGLLVGGRTKADVACQAVPVSVQGPSILLGLGS